MSLMKNFLKLDNHDFININRSTKSGGGVGMYIANHMKYKTRNDLNTNIESIIESVFIEKWLSVKI